MCVACACAKVHACMCVANVSLKCVCVALTESVGPRRPWRRLRCHHGARSARGVEVGKGGHFVAFSATRDACGSCLCVCVCVQVGRVRDCRFFCNAATHHMLRASCCMCCKQNWVLHHLRGERHPHVLYWLRQPLVDVNQAASNTLQKVVQVRGYACAHGGCVRVGGRKRWQPL